MDWIGLNQGFFGGRTYEFWHNYGPNKYTTWKNGDNYCYYHEIFPKTSIKSVFGIGLSNDNLMVFYSKIFLPFD